MFKNSLLTIAFITLLLGCAAQRENNREQASSCKSDTQEANHAGIATRSQAVKKFSGCFANFLKLNGLKEYSASVCAHVNVRANGTVSRASVVGEGAPLSNDLKWCLEQELWKMDYSKLQFSVSQKISFPIKFEVRK